MPRGSDTQQNVNTHFDSTASYWDAVYSERDLQGAIYQQRQAAVLGYVDAALARRDRAQQIGRALEIGCGAGHLTVRLGERNLMVNAVDASLAMVELTADQVRQAGQQGRVDVSLADVHALPFEADKFDLVVAVGVIPWLHSPARAIAEMARVLRPGGQLILTADSATRLSSLTDPRGMLALTPLRRVYHASRDRPGEAVSYLYSPRRIDGHLREAGLRRVDRRTVGFGPLSFLGKPIFSEQRALRIDRRLQSLADRGVPGIRSTGWHYVVRAAKQ